MQCDWSLGWGENPFITADLYSEYVVKNIDAEMKDHSYLRIKSRLNMIVERN